MSPEKKKSFESEQQALVSFFAHELRGLLYIIRGHSELGMSDCHNTECVDNFRAIELASQKAKNLIDNLLIHSRNNSAELCINPSTYDLRACVQSVIINIRPLLQEKGINLLFRSPQISTVTHFDEIKIEWVVRNLLHNAIKFSPPSGTVMVWIDKTEKNGTSFLEFHIRDQGVGVPEEELEIIFEQFKQSSRTKNKKGMGVGLNICKKVVEAHNGTIKAENNQKRGSTFSFTLPLIEPLL